MVDARWRRYGLVLAMLAMSSQANAQTDDRPFRLSIDSLAAGLNANLQRALVTRVEQVLRSLPPSTTQVASFEWDPNVDTWVRSERPGSAAFFSPDLTPPGEVSLKASASYFHIRELERSVDYNVTARARLPFENRATTFVPGQFMRFGVQVSADVATFALAASYGLMSGVELDAVLPIVIVAPDESAFVSAQPGLAEAPQRFGDIHFADSSRALANDIAAGRADLRHLQLGASEFDDSTNVGVGRASLAAKFRVFRHPRLAVSLSTEMLLPSPNEAQFAGSESAAFLPRVLASAALAPGLKGYLNAGYTVDFERNALRNFSWLAGASYSTARAAVDVGLSGAVYNEGLEIFVPSSAVNVETEEARLATSSKAIGAERLPSQFVDIVTAVQVPLTGTLTLIAVATIPVVNVEFRPVAVGTLSLGYRF